MDSVMRYLGTNSHYITADTKRATITRLKFMGTLMPHEKINPATLQIENIGLWTSILRTLSGSSRETTMNFFTNTIERTFEILEANLHSPKTSDKVFCANTVGDLINAVKGIKSAQVTYTKDKLIVCELEALIESVQAFISDLEQRYPEILKLIKHNHRAPVEPPMPDDIKEE